jgi:hypothetical protein
VECWLFATTLYMSYAAQKCYDIDLYRSETPIPTKTRIHPCSCLRCVALPYQGNVHHWPIVSVPPQLIHDFYRFPFPYFLFVLGIVHGKSSSTDFNDLYVKRRVPLQECALQRVTTFNWKLFPKIFLLWAEKKSSSLHA